MAEHVQQTDLRLGYEADRGILRDLQGDQLDEPPVDRLTLQLNPGDADRLAIQTREVAQVGIWSLELDLIRRHGIVGGEHPAVIVGTQPGEFGGGRSAADAVHGRGAGAADDTNRVGYGEDRQNGRGRQLELGGAGGLRIDLVDDAAPRRLEAGPKIVDVVGVTRQHDQVAGRQQVEVGAAAELHRDDLGDLGVAVLDHEVRRL